MRKRLFYPTHVHRPASLFLFSVLSHASHRGTPPGPHSPDVLRSLCPHLLGNPSVRRGPHMPLWGWLPQAPLSASAERRAQAQQGTSCGSRCMDPSSLSSMVGGRCSRPRTPSSLRLRQNLWKPWSLCSPFHYYQSPLLPDISVLSKQSVHFPISGSLVKRVRQKIWGGVYLERGLHCR